jgi:hypothetical protein
LRTVARTGQPGISDPPTTKRYLYADAIHIVTSAAQGGARGK